jgi:ElaB/YqjD/DUF883 family membrane-anchored ribosome-binding protein
METAQGGAGSGAGDRLTGELRALLATAEEVLENTAGQAGEKAAAARARLEAALSPLKARLSEAETSVLRVAREKAASADLYVHKHPWQSVGMGAAVAAGVGFLLGMLIGRR